MSNWALILGASTGHGGATAISLAEMGYGILGFHFDRGETKKEAEKTIEKVSQYNGGKCHYWNTNATSEEKKAIYDGFAKVIKIFDLELDGCRIITNFGKHGRQEVPHLHFHLLGGKDIGSMIS